MFLPSGWFTPVLPPTLESTCGRRRGAQGGRAGRGAGRRPPRPAHPPALGRGHLTPAAGRPSLPLAQPALPPRTAATPRALLLPGAHLRHDGGGHLHKVHAPLVRRRRKARHVSNHAAAQRHKRGVAVQPAGWRRQQGVRASATPQCPTRGGQQRDRRRLPACWIHMRLPALGSPRHTVESEHGSRSSSTSPRTCTRAPCPTPSAAPPGSCAARRRAGSPPPP